MTQRLMLDYIEVSERIATFREKHPDGSLQQVSLDFRQVDDRWWVIYTAAAYRTPDDARPGIGTAWEPVPGTTNFTRGSEVQNAETAAWGRAIVAALAGDTRRSIASAEEVRNARARQEEPTPAPDTRIALINEIGVLAGENKQAVLDEWAAEHDGEHIKDATDLDALRLKRDELAAVA